MKRHGKSLKKTIKYLSICKNPKIISSILSTSPDNVVKSICNAALNTAKGTVHLSKKQKRSLAAHRRFIEQLIQKGETVQTKRKHLLQSGGSFLGIVIPTILSAVLSTLGTKLFK